MRMKWVFGVVVAIAALQLAVVTACGEMADSNEVASDATERGFASTESMEESADSFAESAPPPPTAAPAAASQKQVAIDGSDSSSGGNTKGQPAPLAQNRIIVHSARTRLVVEDVARTVDRIGSLAEVLGGWVVSSDRSSRHSGTVAIRVPAATLDEAISRLEAMALDVESVVVTSQDVTDEYVDSRSRLGSLRATEERLLSFLDRAGDIEDALLVQQEISNLQIQIESLQGRLNFLSQTAAFSLIETNLRVASLPMVIDPGPDIAVRVGDPARFRAAITPPQGIDQFSFEWDFGDGSSAAGSGSLPKADGKYLTATVNHVYEDDVDSPYIATVKVTGAGETGIAEGSGSLEVSVSQVPTIEVFAGEYRTVEEDQDEDYIASFTRHGELWDYQYQWDFGDGSPTVTGELSEGFTRIEVPHAFSDYRVREYEVVLTVSATSDAGQVSGTDSFSVRVTEAEGFFVAGWNVGGTAKSAIRALSAVAKVATTIIIWLAIFSPAILIVLAIVYSANRWAGIRRRFFSRPAREEPSGEEPGGDEPGENGPVGDEPSGDEPRREEPTG